MKFVLSKLWVDRLWDALVNKAHTAIGTAYALLLVGYVWKTGKDIGPGLQTVSGWFYGFLLGHFGFSQKYPDKDEHGDRGQDEAARS